MVSLRASHAPFLFIRAPPALSVSATQSNTTEMEETHGSDQSSDILSGAV